jgi:hypothetical protein
MQETEDNVGGTADKLGGLANTVKGAMKATVAGLAIGAAGLASQVPVVGELVSGLGAIVDSLALKLDSKLRPSLNKITNSFFDIAAAIDEGNYGKVKQEIADLTTELTGLDSISPETILTSLQDGIATATNSLIDSFVEFEEGVSAEDFEGLFLKIGSFLKAGIVNAFDILKNDIDYGELFKSVIKIIGKALVGLAGAFETAVITPIGEYFLGLIELAGGWGQAVLQNFLNGIRGFTAKVVQGVVKVINGIIDGINTIINKLPDEIQSELGIETFGKIEAPSEDDLGGISQDFIGSVATGANKIFLDGQRVDNNQGRFRKDSLTRRGG